MHRKMNSMVLASGLVFVSSLAIGKPAWSEEDTIAARTERREAEVAKQPLEREIITPRDLAAAARSGADFALKRSPRPSNAATSPIAPRAATASRTTFAAAVIS